MLEILLVLVILVVVLAAAWLGFKLTALTRAQHDLPDLMTPFLEEKHRAMLGDLHDGLTRQGDRLQQALTENSERLREIVAAELKLTRDAMQSLQLAQNDSLAQTREAMLKQMAELNVALQAKQDAMRNEVIARTMQTLTEQGRADQELIQTTMKNSTQQLVATVDGLSKIVDTRLQEISGKVTERLDEGFKKTNETFASVMARLATIDEAQKKIDGLTSNVVSLQELLGDKRSRGAFGEVQLENLVRNILPPAMYAMQHTLTNGSRVDCALFLPEPTGLVAVDSKFPLENYHKMYLPGAGELERAAAQKQFKVDVKKHVDDIATKYIIANETSDGAVMFVPAEAVFAEIHAYHPEVVDYAMSKRVWIVSPTTLMAVLNTARAVMKDVETRKQVHIIKDALNKLGREFERFDTRMKKLADHIRMAHDDAVEVHTTSKKISDRFRKIESVELEHPQQGVLEVLEGE